MTHHIALESEFYRANGDRLRAAVGVVYMRYGKFTGKILLLLLLRIIVTI